jgi:hypothetical protein
MCVTTTLVLSPCTRWRNWSSDCSHCTDFLHHHYFLLIVSREE